MRRGSDPDPALPPNEPPVASRPTGAVQDDPPAAIPAERPQCLLKTLVAPLSLGQELADRRRRAARRQVTSTRAQSHYARAVAVRVASNALDRRARARPALQPRGPQ